MGINKFSSIYYCLNEVEVLELQGNLEYENIIDVLTNIIKEHIKKGGNKDE